MASRPAAASTALLWPTRPWAPIPRAPSASPWGPLPNLRTSTMSRAPWRRSYADKSMKYIHSGLPMPPAWAVRSALRVRIFDLYICIYRPYQVRRPWVGGGTSGASTRHADRPERWPVFTVLTRISMEFCLVDAVPFRADAFDWRVNCKKMTKCKMMTLTFANLGLFC